MKFNKLLVIKRDGSDNDGNAMWVCLCDCGNYSKVDGSSLRKGGTKSCGCSKKEPRPNRRKGYDTTERLYRIWANMKNRCNNSKDKEKYSYYGGRGISIFKGWLVYSEFKKWALDSGYLDVLTLDRIDNNGCYSPENCRWVSIKQQCNNRRTNLYITKGEETLTITEWSRKLGVSRTKIKNNMLKGG